MNNRIYLSPPHMSLEEKEHLLDAFNSNWIAPMGPYVDLFENNMSNYLNVSHCAALSSGTAALHLALKIVGAKKGDKVICPSLTFAATANAIIYNQSIPIFIDSEIKNWLVDLDLLEDAFKKYSPKAFISVDLYGNSCNYDEIISLCTQYNVILIEDAAEALGSKYKSKMCGSFGKIGILSFNGNKIITSSGGGMLVSHNEQYVEEAKFLSTQAREKTIHYEHKKLGYNYRMSNICASIGTAQLKRIDCFVNKRREIFNKYYKSLSKFKGIQFLEETTDSNSNFWLTTLTIDKKKTGFSNLDAIESLEKENIESRPVWKPMHLQPFYKGFKYVKKSDSDNSGYLFQNGICLPSGSSLSKKNQNRIIDIICSLF